MSIGTWKKKRKPKVMYYKRTWQGKDRERGMCMNAISSGNMNKHNSKYELVKSYDRLANRIANYK